MGLGVWGLGFGVWGLGFGVWGLGFRVYENWGGGGGGFPGTFFWRVPLRGLYSRWGIMECMVHRLAFVGFMVPPLFGDLP